ncbi:MAG: RICIN domain-containing protein [Bacteroidaceae bacterium]|nr:RICIN domain-containing protein [Bacteroidaceae bacterium]
MNRFFLFYCLALCFAGIQAQTGSDFLQAYKVTDCTIPFDISASGAEYKVNWGMDAAWDWDMNVKRGVNWIGKGNFATGRVSFQPIDLVKDNGDGTYSLTARQQKKLKWRCDLMALTGTTEVNINCDHEALFCKVDADGNYPLENGEKIEDFTGRTNYQGKPEEWYKLIKASVAYVQKQGLTVVSISPFNEPDFVWQQATNESQAMADFLAIAKLIKADPYFDNIRVCGGNTLNDDRALPWYNYLKDYLDEGNTHQLAGSFDNYANFFTQVRADGMVATADELHNVGEAIVGVQYGMQNGIWWGFDSRARGQFCRDSNEGVRIGYGEDRKHWTSGAVYRNDSTKEVHGYIGSSERQANNSSYRFVSTTKDVYFNGYGPMREFVYDLPGGTGYQKGQINAEYSFDITWGEDVPQAPVNGTYQIMNLSSKKMLTYKGTANVQSASRVTSGYSQQWVVSPGYTDGDCSYWFIDNANPGLTSTHLNLLNNNLSAGAGVIGYDAGHAMNEQWFLRYAGEGYWYIINRLSGMYLYCSNTNSGTNVTLQTPPTATTTATNLKKYKWRFQPVDTKNDTKAPAVPTGLQATAQTGSVRLEWAAVADSDPICYNILRGENGEWNTVGRNDTLTVFIDNTALLGHTYQYKVVAVDYAGNRSAPSEEVTAQALDAKRLVMQQQFDGDLKDKTANQLNASFYGTEKYSTVSSMIKSGTHSLNLTSQNSYLELPYAATQLDAMTIAFWVRWSGGDNWQRVFDFGNDTEHYMFLTPSNGSEMRFVMKNGGDEQILSTGSKLRSSMWKHVSVTIQPLSDGNVEVKLYVDGAETASSSAFTIKPSDIAASLCYLGRSQFSADPLFKGYLDDFRIYNYPLTAEEIAKVMADTGEVSQYLEGSILPEKEVVTLDDITSLIYLYLSAENTGQITIEDIARLIDRYLEAGN